MGRDKFPAGIADHLNWYVYRLIDPRNGETFYIGKGQRDRVFQHVKGAVAATEDEDAADLKFQRIKEIVAAGLDVAHVIHRHNIENQEIAYQIEAALIDAYPGLTNKISGHGAGDYGVRHVEQIIREYAAEPFEAAEPLILISIARSYEEEAKDIYAAVRGMWCINVDRARNFHLVLAHRHGLVLGAFVPTKWTSDKGRVGFEGTPAEPAVASLYKGKRVPDAYRAKGAANPVRYIEPRRISN